MINAIINLLLCYILLKLWGCSSSVTHQPFVYYLRRFKVNKYKWLWESVFKADRLSKSSIYLSPMVSGVCFIWIDSDNIRVRGKTDDSQFKVKCFEKRKPSGPSSLFPILNQFELWSNYGPHSLYPKPVPFQQIISCST